MPVPQDGEDRPVQRWIVQKAADLQFPLALGLEGRGLGCALGISAIVVAIEEMHMDSGDAGGRAAQGPVHRGAGGAFEAEDDEEIRLGAQCVQGSLRSTEKLSA